METTKVLVIDDDLFTRMIVRRTLQEQLYDVLEAETGAEGLELAVKESPALIVCDWQMPGMSGIEVCEQVKKTPSLSTTFFILLTSQNSIDHVVMGLNTGADEFLTKPIQSDELCARVRAGLRLHHSLNHLKQLTTDLAHQQKVLEAELAEAAAYVRSLLPPPMSGHVEIESCFLPSRELGGDCFDYYWLDQNRLALYILDVSGHGLGAALLSVSIRNWLRSQSKSELQEPHLVLKKLNQVFEMSKHNEQYFTIWFGIYDTHGETLTYSSAGHPPALLFSDATQSIKDARRLKTRGTPIGMLEDVTFTSETCKIQLPGTLYLYSDGIYEAQKNQTSWNLDAFVKLLSNCNQSCTSSHQVMQTIRTLNHIQQFEDDCALLRVRFNAT